MYLKTQGIPPNNHPVRQELDRVRLYVKKIKMLSGEKSKESEGAWGAF